jgi:hypothetical protein
MPSPSRLIDEEFRPQLRLSLIRMPALFRVFEDLPSLGVHTNLVSDFPALNIEGVALGPLHLRCLRLPNEALNCGPISFKSWPPGY